MTENNSSQHQIPAAERQLSSMAALFPKVTFGLSAAVLAGVMVVTVPGVPDALGAQSATGAATQQVMTTAGLGAVINAAAGITPYETTCCGNKKPTLSLSFPS